MLFESFFVGILILCLLLGLVLNRYSAALMFSVALGLLVVTGILIPQVAFAGFGNTGMLTIAILYVVVAGLGETGAIDMLSRAMMGQPRNFASALLRLLLPATGISAFLNNSPVVAMYIVAIQNWCKRSGFRPSRLLLPMNYAVSLGGMCTLIGTSTNLVVDGMMRDQLRMPGFQLFELAWVGIPVALVGISYLLIAAPRLLPDRHGAMEQFENVREYMVEMVIQPGSELHGQSVQSAGLRNLPALFLVEVLRNEQVFSVVDPGMILLSGDRLVFAGAVDSVMELRTIRGLVPAPDQLFKLDAKDHERRLFEAVLSGANPMIGLTVKEARLRHRYMAVVLSISRHGQRLNGRLGDIRLMAGDTLLLEAQKGFFFKHRNNRDFLLVSKLSDKGAIRHDKAGVALAIGTGMLLLPAVFGWPTLNAALLAAGMMLVTGCVTLEDAQRSIDYPVLCVVACAFGLGVAIEKVGLAALLAQYALHGAGGGAMSTLIVVYFATFVLTQILTNNAAAIIMFPIAIRAAQALGVHLEPFAIAVMIAASASFMTPIGYQTNLMVMGPGGYHFLDYIKFGAPLSLLVAITSLVLIPIIWPF